MHKSPARTSAAFWRVITLFACCLLGSLIARGLMLPQNMSLSEGISIPNVGFSRDGWVHGRAELQFPGYSSVGNSLRMQFDAARPGEPAQFDIFQCGMPKGRWTIGSGEQVIKLGGGCEPQIVSFQIVNPIQVHPQDSRQLGSKINSIKITSRLGFPIPAASSIVLTAAVYFVTVFSLYIATTSIVPAIIGIAACAFVHEKFLASPEILNALWILITGLLYGIGVGRFILRDRRRSFRSAFDSTPQFNIYTFACFAAVILGGYLRYGGMSFGLPDHFHPDEIPKAQVILRMYESGSFNPQYFLHPSLLLYLSYTGSLLLHYFGVDEFYQTTFLAGRIVSATAGTFSILLVYFIGRTLYGQSAGAIAALLLAVFPLHVTSSRYMKEDALLLFLILLCLSFVLHAARSGRSRDLYSAALFAGLCASAKYSGAVASLLIISTPWIRSRSIAPDPKLLSSLPIALVCIVIGFLIGTPFSLLDYHSFLQGITYEKKHMLRGHTESISAWSQAWMYHWGRSIIPGISTIAALFGAFAIGLLLYRRKLEDLLLIAIFLIFYLPAEWVKAKPAPQPERYILPCLPFLALIIAEGFHVMWHDGRRITTLLILGVCLYFPAMRSIELYSELNPDTRAEASKWISQNIPHQSKVVLDFAPYSPTVDASSFQIINNPLLPIGSWLDIAKLRTYQVDYIILSSLSYDRFFSQPGQPPDMRIRLRRIFALPLEKEFSPLHGTYGFHNPTIRIYRVSTLK